MSLASTPNPQVGMLATVRNRRGVVSGVRPHDGPQGRLHVVDVEYNDGETPFQESLLWEREPGTRLLEATALPPVESSRPMDFEELLALIRACRWSAHMPYVDPDGAGPLDRLPLASPFHGAIQIEDYQLVPLLKALKMPRVSLLIADDVGLGKTVEAGLILSELLLRRRIRRVLVLTPASLRVQWRDELDEKFSLPFEIVDRESTLALRRQLGMHANPWRTHSRIIASYHYLKQHDVLEEFLAPIRDTAERLGPRLPWDLLIVDEAHNLAPVPIGEESQLTRMLRQIAPYFEHRLFLTATPHNGHTASFTGLLEMLDPVRFSQTRELKPAERERIPDVLIRRLKRDINARAVPPPFCERLAPEALGIDLAPAEQRLAAAFASLRQAIHDRMAQESRGRRLAGSFAIEILGKRLLSCPVAFADSWWRCRRGLDEAEAVSDREVTAAKRSIDEETVDDREAEARARAASTAVGAWLRPLAADLQGPFAAIDAALEELGLGRDVEAASPPIPTADSRYTALRRLIDERLRTDGRWRDDERLVVFTEYKTTLDYLLHRLRQDYEDERVLYLYGGMSEHGGEETLGREDVKAAFNDPGDPVRILVATDAASEGLNLQESARYLLHWDVPWNPARLEQRNGRLDRHGQPRDVQTWHFVSEDDRDIAFLDHVVRKVHTIREDLGATGEVFDELTWRRLVGGEDADAIQRELDAKSDAARNAAAVHGDSRSSTAEDDPDGRDAAARLEALAAELDLSRDTLRETLDVALGMRTGRPRLEPVPQNGGRHRLLPPYPPAWQDAIDDHLRLRERGGAMGAVRLLAFDPHVFLTEVGGRSVFRPRPDTCLLHLAHPLIRRALVSLARLRFPGTGEEMSRWNVRFAPTVNGADALILVTVEELAVNALRETFHHWIRTLALPVTDGDLGPPLPHRPASEIYGENGSAGKPPTDRARSIAAEVWEAADTPLREHLRQRAARLTEELTAQLAEDGERAIAAAREQYQSRLGEISKLIEASTLARLEREIAELKAERAQGRLFAVNEELDKLDRSIEEREEELKRRRRHYDEVREVLTRERERTLNELLPNRYTLRGEAQVLPVAVEILLPEAAS